MALSARIRRPDGQPLGRLEEVRHRISEAFPGVTFVVDTGDWFSRPRGFSLWALYLSLFPPRFPRVQGTFHTDEFATEFELGSEPSVRKVDVTLYGRTTLAKSHLVRLTEATGWAVKY